MSDSPTSIAQMDAEIELLREHVEQLEAELRIKDRGLDAAISLNNEQVQEIGRLERDLAMAMDAARKGDDARAILGGMQMDASNYDTNVAILTQQRDQLERTLQAVMARLADLLGEDQFNNIEAIVCEAGVRYPDETGVGTSPATAEIERLKRENAVLRVALGRLAVNALTEGNETSAPVSFRAEALQAIARGGPVGIETLAAAFAELQQVGKP